jgi:CRP-like cAMP-binding protein
MVQTMSPVILRNSFLFKEVGTDVLSDVVKHCQRMELLAGETLFEQDSEPDAMYFLEEGQIHVVRHYPSGTEVILATEVPYYIIGELSMLANLPRTGSVVAVGNCDLIRVSREAVEEISHKHPDVPLKALKHLGERLYKLNLHVRESAIGNITARIASVLLLLSNEQNGEIFGLINNTRLARATALDVDVVDHTMKKWVSEGILSVEGQTVSIHDIHALKNIAG